MTFLVIWRIDEGGDYFEQAFKNQKSARLAIKAWRKTWGLHESECVIFEIIKSNEQEGDS